MIINSKGFSARVFNSINPDVLSKLLEAMTDDRS
jgi:hypothetical protein